MRIDVHVHLSSPRIIENRSVFFLNEPSVAPIYSDPKARVSGTEELLREMEAGEIDKALVMGFAFLKEDNARRQNDWILEECLKHPGVLYPLAAFDPRADFAIKASEEFLANGGFGLGELCVYEEGLSPETLDTLEALCALAKEKDKTVLVHVNEPVGHKYPGKAPIELSEIHSLVKRSGGCKLILAHFGGGLPFFASLKKEMRESLANVRFDTAAMPFIFDPAALRLGADLLGPESFLHGSDHPLLGTARYEKYLAAAKLTPEEISLVMGENAKNFLGL